MFCRKCGTEFRAGARFCGKCGSPKPVIKPAAAKATTSSASAPKKVPETPKRIAGDTKTRKKVSTDKFYAKTGKFRFQFEWAV